MSNRLCIFDSIESQYNFGKYKGLSLADVLDIDPSYFYWSINECDGVQCMLTEDSISQIKVVYPETHFSGFT